MKTDIYELNFDGDLLERGFWLYVWEITTPSRTNLYYVGRTGDSSSDNAQSPFNRMAQHLGFNGNSNPLRRYLRGEGVTPEECHFRLVAHGPILKEAESPHAHRKRRDCVSAMEKALATAMTAVGYRVMNRVHCRIEVDAQMFKTVRAAFNKQFPKLANDVEKR